MNNKSVLEVKLTQTQERDAALVQARKWARMYQASQGELRKVQEEIRKLKRSLEQARAEVQ